MGYMTIATEMAAALRETHGPTEFRDPNGQVLGFFNPIESAEDARLVRRAHELFDLKEAEETWQRERGKGITTPELLERLRSLAPDA